MISIKKILIIVSIIAISVIVLFACKKQTQVNEIEYRKFVDSMGREVSVKKDIKKVAITGPLAQITVFPIAADKLVGISTPFTDIAKKFFDKKYLELPVIGQLYGSSGSLNLETLINTGADVVIDVGAAKSKVTNDFDEIMTKTGIPMVHITLDINAIDKTYDMLGDLLNEKEKAKEIGMYLKNLVQDTENAISKIKKKKIAYCLGENGLNVISEKSYFSEVINMVADNAVKIDNPTSKGTGDRISIEELFNINPEYIIFDNENIEKYIRNRLEWGKLDAIKNNKYYIVPETPFNIMGFPPAIQKILGARWLMSVLYPDEINIDIGAEFKTFFKNIYLCDINDEKIEKLLGGKMNNNIFVNANSSIMIEEKGYKFYFDPFEITEEKRDADFVFITHEHFDHLDKGSIDNIKKEETYYICPATVVEKVAELVGGYDRIYVLKADKTIVHRDTENEVVFSVQTIPSYNVDKEFHKKDKGYLGYILDVNNTKYYVAGDTDVTEENKKVECDVAFVPIGGTYTMDYKEAAELINTINPKIAIPTHYGSVVGDKADGERFRDLINKNIEVRLILKTK